MYFFVKKIKIFLCVLIMGLLVISCKSDTTKTNKKAGNKSTDETTTTTDDSSSTSTSSDDDSSSSSSSSGGYSEESYNSGFVESAKLDTCKGLYKLGSGCDTGWTKEYRNCYVDAYTNKTDTEYHKKISEYVRQGYNRVLCYTSGSSEAVSLIKYDGGGVYQKVVYSK